jgi:hypothetical protein
MEKKTRQVIYVSRNTQAGSRKNCYREKQYFTLLQAMQVLWESRFIAILLTSALDGVVKAAPRRINHG